MKDNIIFVASLIIIGFTIIVLATMMNDLIKKIIKKHKAKELRILRLAMREGDEKAELKLKEQLLFYKKRLKEAEETVEKRQDEFDRFQDIFDLFNPEINEEKQTVRLPKNLKRLSFDDENDNQVFLMYSELEEFLQVQKDIENQEQRSRANTR